MRKFGRFYGVQINIWKVNNNYRSTFFNNLFAVYDILSKAIKQAICCAAYDKSFVPR